MILSRWFRSCPSSAARPVCRPQRRARPALEPLEDRTLLSAAPLDDFGNTFADAQSITLSAIGGGSQQGTIDYVGDVDVFRFVAPLSGRMTIHQDSVPNPRPPEDLLSLYDAAQTPPASNRRNALGDNSTVAIQLLRRT